MASPADPSETQNRWAAALHFGPGALLTGREALVVDGWTGGSGEAMDVLVPKNTRRQSPKWIRPHRSSYIPVSAKKGVPRVPPHHAAINAASTAKTERQSVFIILSCLQQNVADERGIRRALDDMQCLPRRQLILQTLAEFGDGITTMGERDFAHLCKQYGLPAPDRQVRRKDSQGRSRYLDVFFEEAGIVVEIDGLGHLDLEMWMDDQVRQNDLVIHHGYRCLRTSTVALRWKPEVFMAQLAAALEVAVGTCSY